MGTCASSESKDEEAAAIQTPHADHKGRNIADKYFEQQRALRGDDKAISRDHDWRDTQGNGLWSGPDPRSALQLKSDAYSGATKQSKYRHRRGDSSAMSQRKLSRQRSHSGQEAAKSGEKPFAAVLRPATALSQKELRRQQQQRKQETEVAQTRERATNLGSADAEAAVRALIEPIAETPTPTNQPYVSKRREYRNGPTVRWSINALARGSDSDTSEDLASSLPARYDDTGYRRPSTERRNDFSYDPEFVCGVSDRQLPPTPVRRHADRQKRRDDFSYEPQHSNRHDADGVQSYPGQQTRQSHRPHHASDWQPRQAEYAEPRLQTGNGLGRRHGRQSSKRHDDFRHDDARSRSSSTHSGVSGHTADFRPRQVKLGSSQAQEAEAYILQRRKEAEARGGLPQERVHSPKPFASQGPRDNRRPASPHSAEPMKPSAKAGKLAITPSGVGEEVRLGRHINSSENSEVEEAVLKEFPPEDRSAFLRIKQRLANSHRPSDYTAERAASLQPGSQLPNSAWTGEEQTLRTRLGVSSPPAGSVPYMR